MPQMMPMNWFMLLMLFSSALILFAIVNYFIFLYSLPSPTNSASLDIKPLNWKW
uniref:ATP synthase complex subunit 8 n=1 Tax=Zichya tenggerensis TaxID=2844940 RepID=A0A8F1SWQ2_9ORTH|nr:ATP synthase F0 subunit 8 [Zichya tenggerensis]